MGLRLPNSVLIAIGAVAVGSASVIAAFLVTTMTVDVEVTENIILDSPQLIELTLFPSETAEIEVILRNIGPEDQGVEIKAELITLGNGITVASPGQVVVLAGGGAQTFLVGIVAASDVEPGGHTIEIEIERQ